MEFLAKEIKKSFHLSMPEASAIKALSKKKALYILSWVGGVRGGIQEIYRAFQFNVNAIIPIIITLSRTFFLFDTKNRESKMI